jgi:hypothetical protein
MLIVANVSDEPVISVFRGNVCVIGILVDL